MDGRWVLLTLVVAAAAAIRWRRRPPEPPDDPSETAAAADADRRRRPDSPAAPAPAPRPRRRSTIDGSVVDGSLHEALERVWAEHASSAEALLYARLHQLVQRGVPVRAIRRAPGGQVVRVVFADNTVVLCQGTGIGDFGRLGLAMHRSAVRLSGYAQEEAGTRLEFRWSTRPAPRRGRRGAGPAGLTERGTADPVSRPTQPSGQVARVRQACCSYHDRRTSSTSTRAGVRGAVHRRTVSMSTPRPARSRVTCGRGST